MYSSVVDIFIQINTCTILIYILFTITIFFEIIYVLVKIPLRQFYNGGLAPNGLCTTIMTYCFSVKENLQNILNYYCFFFCVGIPMISTRIDVTKKGNNTSFNQF